MSTPVTAKAPTAYWKPSCEGDESASSAAPGMDQAMLIGMRYRRLRKIAQMPIGRLAQWHRLMRVILLQLPERESDAVGKSQGLRQGVQETEIHIQAARAM